MADTDITEQTDDPVLEAEQAHLDELYAELVRIRDHITKELGENHAESVRDLLRMSEEVHVDAFDADEQNYDDIAEAAAAIETLNGIIDTYNLYHDSNVEKLRRVTMLLLQPFFAKVTLEMRPGRQPRDVYIGNVGITDERSRPLVVDWRSPVAETYYNQEMGQTSYSVDGRVRTANLLLRRQFDVVRDQDRKSVV